MKTIKILSSEICSKCGEIYSFYISKKGNKKGILSGEYIYEGFMDSHYGDSYDCYTCGNHWNIRKSELPWWKKLFGLER